MGGEDLSVMPARPSAIKWANIMPNVAKDWADVAGERKDLPGNVVS